MNLFKIFWVLSLATATANAVTMNFTGQIRNEASLYQGTPLGRGDIPATKTFVSSRALLTPTLVIDDHFSVKSQWSLLTSPAFTPDATGPIGLSHGQGGFIFGDTNPSTLRLTRAWLEWTSDFGVFRMGRMPVSWGYGLIYDGGNGIWDDFQTTLDRLEYRLHLGHIVGGLAYSKARKLSVLASDNDQEFYAVYLQYDNPEVELEWGAMFERQIRSGSQAADLANSPSNPYHIPTTKVATSYPLAQKSPYPTNNNVLDVYVKKRMGGLTFGGEAGWVVGSATDYGGVGRAPEMSALGFMLNASYEFEKVKLFLESVYASGDASLSSGHSNGFVLLHRNRRPGLILGRELLGPYASNTVGMGSPVVYGNAGSFSGVYYFRPGLRVDWSSSWASGLEVIVAQKAVKQPGEVGHLGIEVDLGTDHAVYKNFDLGLNLGYLIPGKGLGIGNPSGVFAVRTTAVVKF